MAGKTPVKFSKKSYADAERLASSGFSRTMIAQHLGMAPATLYRRMEKDARLKEALTRGDESDIQECVNVLREKALGGSAMHMDRYLQIRHGLFIGNAKPCGIQAKEAAIVVVVPFETGQSNWKGEVIEGNTDTHLTHAALPHMEAQQ